MAIKTMLRQLLGHYGIMSIDMETAYLSDQAIIDDGMQPRYVDSPEAAIASAQEEIAENANAETIDVTPETPAATAPAPADDTPEPGF